MSNEQYTLNTFKQGVSQAPSVSLSCFTWYRQLHGTAGQRLGHLCMEGGVFSRQGPPPALWILKSRVNQVREGGTGSGDSCPGRCVIIWHEDGCWAQGWPRFSFLSSPLPTCTWYYGYRPSILSMPSKEQVSILRWQLA